MQTNPKTKQTEPLLLRVAQACQVCVLLFPAPGSAKIELSGQISLFSSFFFPSFVSEKLGFELSCFGSPGDRFGPAFPLESANPACTGEF